MTNRGVSGLVTDFYSTGEIFANYECVGGKRVGKYIEFFLSGEKMLEIDYINDRRHG
ncbi:MAG: hypothetical protein Harvfovirus79_1, partial [Harvfovirus sp.]